MYAVAGWTRIGVAADQPWRLTSVTVALAVSETGNGGLTVRKSMCRTWAPVASVLPSWVNVLGERYSSSPDIHHAW